MSVFREDRNWSPGNVLTFDPGASYMGVFSLGKF